MEIQKLNSNENYPMELLLLADPSKKLVEEYLKRGECFVAIKDKRLIDNRNWNW